MKKFLTKNGLWLLLFCLSFSISFAQDSSWYRFTQDNKECIIKNPDLPTPWLNRLGNDVFFTWITQNGYIESYMLDPVENGLTNPQSTSGHIYIRDKRDGHFFQVNTAENNAEWEGTVGIGYTKISHNENGLQTRATYFIPREDDVLVVIVDITNASSEDRSLDIFNQVEWNLGDPVKSFIYKGDGRGGSQFNLYKEAFMQNNTILAKQKNWRSTANCKPWPYTGFFSVNERVSSFETIKENFLGPRSDYNHPVAVAKGMCSNTNFWSQAEYPWGVLQNTFDLKKGETKTFIYTLGMSRNESDIPAIVDKYNNKESAQKSLAGVQNFYNSFLTRSINVETPDRENDRQINIWTKYMWRQFWKKSLNNGAYGLGLWSYGLEGEAIGTAPEQFLLPFDMSILKNAIINQLTRQVSDTTQTDLFAQGTHTLSYKDLGIDGPDTAHKGKFAVPHHHSIYDMFSIYYYILESGDLHLLDSTLPYLDGKNATVWDHIKTGMSIAVKGIDERGLPKIPANVGDWMDEFTQISKDGNAESEMLGAEIAFLLRGYAEIAQKTNHEEDSRHWMSIYNRIKDAVNKLAWEGDRFIRAFSDRGNPYRPVGSKTNEEGSIYLNGQSWPILSGIATPQQASQSLQSVRKYLMSEFGPLVFSPSYSKYTDYIGTQSIYAPGFRNACIYLRPAGWAIAAACLNNDSKLANDMYNAASLKNISRNTKRYRCEPYAYPENYNGPDHRLKGQGEFQWNLGEGSAWMWTSYVNYILGVRPEIGGLIIDPKIPSEWPGFKVTRPFRASTYHIKVINPNRVSSGVVSIKVDNKKIKGNVIPSYNDGKDHNVEVLMGATKKSN